MLIRRSGTQVIGERQAVSLPGEVDLASAADFTLGPLEAHPSTLQLRFAGDSRTIEPRVMQVLVLLASERGNVVSRDRLIDCCWGGRVVSEDAINRSIAKVRRVGQQSGAFEIETIPRVGYRLLAADAPIAPTVVKAPLARRLLLAVAAVFVFTLVAGAIGFWRTRSAEQQPTVAVVPFAALDSDADTRDVGESISAAVSSALAQTGAHVLDGDIRSIDEARKSGAAILISGTIRRDGPMLRVTARVDSAHTGSTILSNEFQDGAAAGTALSGRVAAWLVPSIRMWSSFLPIETDPAVTDEILRVFLTRTAGDSLRAWKLSEALAQRNRGSGSAQFLYSLLTSDVLRMMTPDQRGPAVQSARQAAVTAARLLPRPERVSVVLDCHLTPPGWLILTPKCDKATRAAIAADPDVPVLPFLFGAQLADTGRFLESAKFVDMDLAENPLGPGQLYLRIAVGRMMHGGDADDSLPQLESRLRRYIGPNAVAPDDFEVAVANGDWTSAEALINNPVFGDGLAVGDARTTVLAVLRALRSGAPADVATMRNACNPPQLDWTPAEPAFSTCLAGFATRKDLDDVFALADRAFRDVTCCSPAEQERQWLATGGDYYPRRELFGKALAGARADPRFIEVARRTGLLTYWKSGHPPDFCSFERAPVCDLLRR